MTREQIEAEFERIVNEDGPWTAASFEIAPGLWTLEKSDWRTSRATFALRNACLMLNKSPDQIRVLDLGCLEGSMSIPLAQRGCEVVGLEIRQPSLRKAQFAADALGLRRVSWIQADMLKLSTLGLGTFDLVLCFGTLYHVDAPDLLQFLKAINAVTRGLAIFDTHIALRPAEAYIDGSGMSVQGRSIIEHQPGAQLSEKEKKLWASAQNEFSFWPTERSLMNLIVGSGFGQVYRAMLPVPEWPWQDRHWWLAYSSVYTDSKTVGVGPQESLSLADPDARPAECQLINQPGQRDVTNPATVKLSAQTFAP